MTSESRIDPSALPGRIMLDTGVMMRALLQRKDSETPICRELLDAAISVGRTILIATPTIAELMRGGDDVGKPPDLPVSKNIVVVPLDYQAAVVLGEKFPMSAINAAADGHQYPKGYFKYDALILACAIAHKANAFITLDRRLRSPDPNLRICEPWEFTERQFSMAYELPEEQATSSADQPSDG